MKCPICRGTLELREVAPCFDCGHEPNELEELQRGEHQYRWYQAFGQRILLCDFCDADFGSYFPDYFGLAGELPVGRLSDCLEPLESVTEPRVTTDGYCASCQHRLAFLLFLRDARKHNAAP